MTNPRDNSKIQIQRLITGERNTELIMSQIEYVGDPEFKVLVQPMSTGFHTAYCAGFQKINNVSRVLEIFLEVAGNEYK